MGGKYGRRLIQKVTEMNDRNPQAEKADTHFERFQLAMANTANRILAPGIEKNHAEIADSIEADLLGEDRPLVSGLINSRDELFFCKAFYLLHEITLSVECIEDIEVYLQNHQTSPVSQVRYLRYHVDGFLNELYILQERLLSYLDFIEKRYRRNRESKNISERVTSLHGIIKNTLGPLMKTRGAHVHQSRYSDKYLDRVSSLSLLVELLSADDVKMAYEKSLMVARIYWLDQVKAGIKLVRALLEGYFKNLHELLFDNDEKLKYPSCT